MDEDQVNLVTEQLGRLADRVNSRIEALEEKIGHHSDLDGERIDGLKAQLVELKQVVEDHEQRIRDVSKQTTQNTVVLGLASGGSVAASLAALLKAFLGGP